MIILDSNGIEIAMGDIVEVPDPDENGGDTHSFAFQGTVVHIDHENNMVSVRDQEDDVFDIEPDRLTISEDSMIDDDDED